MGRVGLLPIANQTGSTDLEWVELGLMEMVGRTLEQYESVDLTPPAEVLQVIDAMGLDSSNPLTAAEIKAVCATLGAEMLIAAKLTQKGAQYAIQYSIHRKSGVLGQRPIHGLDVVELANAMARRLAIRLAPEEQYADMGDVFSEDPFLNRVFATGYQHLNVKGAQEAQAFFEVCLTKDPDFHWARVYQALCQITLGDVDAGTTTMKELLVLARKNTDTRMVITISENLASLYTDQGKFDEAQAHLKEALDLCVGPKFLKQKGKVHRILGKMAYLQGDHDQAQTQSESAIDIFHKLGDAYYESESLALLGSVFLGRGDIENAEKKYRKAADLARKNHLTAAESRALGNLGNIALFTNRHEDAQVLLTQSLAYVEKTGDMRNILAIKNSLAVVALTLKQPDRAEKLFLEVVEGSQTLGLTEFLASAYLNLADIHLRRRQPEKAHPLIDSALSLNTWIKDSFYADYYNAFYLYESGNLNRAFVLIQQAKDSAPGGQWIEENEALYQCFKKAADRGSRERTPFQID